MVWYLGKLKINFSVIRTASLETWGMGEDCANKVSLQLAPVRVVSV